MSVQIPQFDTMVHVHAYDSIPEKWQRQWKEATVGHKQLILFEPLIAEILYQLTEKKFKEYGLSLVDSFSLAIAKEERADIFTTEHGLRDAGEDFGVRVSFLPKEILKK